MLNNNFFSIKIVGLVSSQLRVMSESMCKESNRKTAKFSRRVRMSNAVFVLICCCSSPYSICNFPGFCLGLTLFEGVQLIGVCFHRHIDIGDQRGFCFDSANGGCCSSCSIPFESPRHITDRGASHHRATCTSTRTNFQNFEIAADQHNGL